MSNLPPSGEEHETLPPAVTPPVDDDERGSSFSWMKDPPWPAVFITLGGIVVMLLVALAIPPLRETLNLALHGDTSGLRTELRGMGAWGGIVVVVLGGVHAVVWYPSEILDLAVGYVYGFWVGLGLLMAAWALCAVIAYAVGRGVGRPLLEKIVGPDRFSYIEQLIARGGITLLIIVRLIPIVPFAPFCMVAGATGVPFWRFLWTSVIAYIPLTAMFVYLGTRLETVSATDPVVWIGAALLVALVIAGHYAGRALHRRQQAEAGSGDLG